MKMKLPLIRGSKIKTRFVVGSHGSIVLVSSLQLRTGQLAEAELGPRKAKKRQRDLSSDSDSDFSDSRIPKQNVTPTSTKTLLPAVPLTLARSSSTEVVYQFPETSDSAQSTETLTLNAMTRPEATEEIIKRLARSDSRTVLTSDKIKLKEKRQVD